MAGLGFRETFEGTLSPEDQWAFLDEAIRAAKLAAKGGSAGGFSMTDWLKRNSTAVYVGAAVLVGLAVLGGRRR